MARVLSSRHACFIRRVLEMRTGPQADHTDRLTQCSCRGENVQLASNKTQPLIGGDFTRIEGPLKVSGAATYTSDFNFPGMLYAVPVCATIAKGRINQLETAGAAKMPGVRAVFTRQNIGKFYRVGFGPRIDERRPPLDDDIISYYG